jgi:DNA-binding transcriptional LysR family regulator
MPHSLPAGAAPMQCKKLETASNPSWEDLRVFLLCARHRSYKSAADVMGLTATALIKRIEKLEDELGCKLFTLEKTSLSLSGEGRALLFDVEQMERLSRNIFRRASAPSDQRQRAHCRNRGARQFLDPAAPDQVSGELSKYPGGSSLRAARGQQS